MRAFLMLLLITIVVIFRAFFAPAHANPFARLDAKGFFMVSSDSGGIGSDEIAPLKIAKLKRKIHHFPPYVPTELPDCVGSLYSFGPDLPPVSTGVLPFGRSGPETPPPIRRA